MRFVSLVLAILVAAALAMWILQRDRVNAFFAEMSGGAEAAQVDTGPDGNDVVADTPAVEDVPDATDGMIRVLARKSIAREVDSAVILRGQTEAMRQVEARSETSSTVISPPLRKGAFIDEGQLLCQLDPGTRASALAEARASLAEAIAAKSEAESRVPEARARVIEWQARIDEAEVNQNAARRLSEGGFAAETRVKNTEAALAAAEASLEGARAGVTGAIAGLQAADARIQSATASVATAEKELERLEIRAPFGGTLESDTAELGSLLQAGSLCATVIQLDPIKLVAFVPETEVDRVKVGANAQAKLAAGDRKVTGQVKFLSRSADPTTRTFRVELEVPNTDLTIRDGQTAEIVISSAGEQAHLLPSSALTLNEEGRLGLRVLNPDSVVEFAPVSVLRDTVDGVWLTGLPQTVDVIVVGQEFVTAGVKVAPTFEEQTQ
ncbi:efflux RND transporter periplasmic adaptor subunit [uncultured Tateyamaria sp.]|uniref:efflux RND transporter periplasmic adaptor subunit n=1 Tax=uncultured Tateyamaria sp. TaxID=455651 RepID=UPI00260F227E|nr:efflux RND transporter periplasmic adaptor subunit [uncultured Tateyamaria sp.]